MLLFKEDHPLVEGIFLLELTTPTCTSLMAMSSGIQNIANDIKSFEFCTPTSGSKYNQSCTFVYNNENIFYYILFFKPYPDSPESYELVIKSYQRCAHFYLDYFERLLSAFDDDKSPYDPNKIFNLAKVLISGWPTKLSNKMEIVYPDTFKSVEFTINDFTYHYYKSSLYFKPKLYTQIFDHLISQKPILLVVSDAIHASHACFSALSLLHPLRYMEPMIFWLRNDDPRYQEIKESPDKSPYFLVATDDPSDIKKKFDLVIQISDSDKKLNEKADIDFEEIVKNILLTIQGEFKNSLNKNPYSDVLNLPWIGPEIDEVYGNPKFSFMPTLDTLKIFERTNTCRFWRTRRCVLENMREPLLQSGNVDMAQFDKEQLETISDFYNSVKGKYEDDVHLKVVIKRHKSLVANQLTLISSDQSNE